MAESAPTVAGAAPAALLLPGVIDIEASGFGAGSYPIEVGFVLPGGQSYCTLVQPAAAWTHWDGRAERVHGITRAMLQTHGRPAREVALALNLQLQGSTLHCDGWAHDYTWLAVLFEEAGMAPSFQLRHLHELLDDGMAAAWDQACTDARQALALQRHRASGDARVLQLAFARLKGLAPT